MSKKLIEYISKEKKFEDTVRNFGDRVSVNNAIDSAWSGSPSRANIIKIIANLLLDLVEFQLLQIEKDRLSREKRDNN